MTNNRNHVRLARRNIVPSEFTRENCFPIHSLFGFLVFLSVQECQCGVASEMTFYSIWVVLFLNAIFVLYKKKIHGDRIISDEGISVCFQHLLFGWFLFCLGQS